MTLSEDLTVSAAEAVALENSLTAANAALASAEDLLDLAKIEIADLKQQLADCQAEPGPGPEPIPTVTDFGACPVKGGSASAVMTKWGKGTSIRSFATGAFTTVTPPTDSGTFHQSWKPALGSPINGTNVAAACKNLRAGDVVEIWHEADVKYRSGAHTASQSQQIVDMKNWFYDAVHSVRPDLFVATTYAAWMFESSMYPGTSGDPAGAEFWSKVKADYVGIDCDGIAGLTKYPDFTTEIANVKDYIAKHTTTYKGWSVPEFNHPRISTDPNGSQRAAMYTTQGNKFITGGAVYAMLFDYNTRPNTECAVGSAEHTAWKAFI